MTVGPFPSPSELTVASALLLLSESNSRSPSPTPKNCFEDDLLIKEESESGSSSIESLSFVSTGSKSCSSSLTSEISSMHTPAHKLRLVAVVARCYAFKLKVARRKRSKVCWGYSQNKVAACLPPTKSSESMSAETSCLSSTSSAASSARSSRYIARDCKKDEAMSHQKLKKTDNSAKEGSACVRRRAEAIKKLLSTGYLSEMGIRAVLGDSPDTSKALRMLLKLKEVKRSGAGGRHDPYIYTIA